MSVVNFNKREELTKKRSLWGKRSSFYLEYKSKSQFELIENDGIGKRRTSHS